MGDQKVQTLQAINGEIKIFKIKKIIMGVGGGFHTLLEYATYRATRT